MAEWIKLAFRGKVSQAELQLRFDGPDLKAHAMDVSLLGPSLIAFGELCVEANSILNGSNAKVRVLVKADVKANCITIDLQLLQTVWQQAVGLIANPNIVTAKEILEWIGIIGGGGTVAVGSIRGAMLLIEFLKWKKDRKEKSADVEHTQSGNLITVQVEGDGNNIVVVSEPVYKLSKSVKIVESIKTMAQPVSQETGIDDAVFIHDKKEYLKIDKELAGQLKNVHADADNVEPQTFTAHIVIYGPTLDSKSKHWKFKLNNKVENLDISETKIAEEAMARGGVWVGDTYKVKVEMIERMTRKGEYKTEFKVKQVLEFIPGIRRVQTDML